MRSAMAKDPKSIIEQIRALVGIDTKPARKNSAKKKSKSKRVAKKAKQKTSKRPTRRTKAR